MFPLNHVFKKFSDEDIYFYPTDKINDSKIVITDDYEHSSTIVMDEEIGEIYIEKQ